MGRVARGVRGVTLGEDDAVVGMVVVRRDATLLTATRHGMGKRTPVDEYRTQRRGGKGLINLRLTARTGDVVAVREVTDEDELMLVTRGGVINRQGAAEIRVIGRNTQGVRLISLDDGDELVDVARIAPELEELGEEEAAMGDATDGEEELVAAADPGDAPTEEDA
jgi:DNA gyrase subunit A